MEITGKLHKIYPIETKEWENKTFKSQHFTLHEPHKDNPKFDRYPCFVVKNEKTIEILSKFKSGNIVSIKYDMTSKEYNNKPSYVENIAWSISGEQDSQSSQSSNQQNNTQSTFNQEDVSDLPF